MPTCIRCGAELTPPFRFCAKCGTPQTVWGPGPGYPPLRKENHLVLIIVIVVVVAFLSTFIMAALLYVMTSNLITPGTPLKPVVTFDSPSVTVTTVTLTVAGAVPAVSISNYQFNLVLNGVGASVAVGLAAGTNTITCGGTSFWVTYTDASGNGNLKSGDVLRIQAQPSGALLPSGSYIFVLLWTSDGSTIQSLQWNV